MADQTIGDLLGNDPYDGGKLDGTSDGLHFWDASKSVGERDRGITPNEFFSNAPDNQIPNSALVNDSIGVSAGSGISTSGDGVLPLGETETYSLDESYAATWTSKQTFNSGLDAGSSRITSVLDPTNPQDAATRSFVEANIEGLTPLPSVRAATDGSNIDLSSITDPNPIDGVTLSDGDYVLVKDQTSASENGVYEAVTATDPTTWTRIPGMDEDSEVVGGEHTFVREGTVNADQGWYVTSDSPVLSTDPIVWEQFNALGQVTASTGINRSGDTLTLDEAVLKDGGAKEIDLDEFPGANGTNGQVPISDGAAVSWGEVSSAGIATDAIGNDELNNSDAFTFNGVMTLQDSVDFENSITQTASGTNGSYTTSGDTTIFVDTATNSTAFTVTVASADIVQGRRIYVKDAGGGAGTNAITIDTEGTETIDGSASITLDANNESVLLESDGSDLFVLSRLQGGGIL